MFRSGIYRTIYRSSLALAVVAACSKPPTQPSSAPRGPGAGLACQSSGKNAYDTYGRATFFAITKAVFANVGAELTAHGETNLGGSIPKSGTNVSPAYADSLATFEGKVAAYFVWAYGGPPEIEYSDGKTYAGPQDMTAAHAGMNLTGAQYDYFATAIVVPALVSVGIKHGDPDDIASCFAPVVTDPAYKAAMVGK